MSAAAEAKGARLFHGRVEDVLPELDGPFDAVLCDPPYGLAFMGKAWDHGVPGEPIWRDVLALLRPGAHLMAFGGTRTFHRLTCGIEDAGFEIRDCLSWLYGSGFPKSLDVSKAIDRQRYDRADVLRVTEWVRTARDAAGLSNRDIDAAFGFCGMAGHWTSAKSQPAVPTIDQVPTLLALLDAEPPEDVRRLLWDLNGGRGEPGVNWGKREKVGERNVPIGHAFAGATYGGDSSAQRIDETTAHSSAARHWQGYGTALKPAWEPCVLAMKPTDGTFAANALGHGVAGLNVDASRIPCSDKAPFPVGVVSKTERVFGAGSGRYADRPRSEYADPGGRWPANVLLDEEAGRALDEQSGASRFFYCAKASKSERTAGGTVENPHPTLKPLKLTEYLAKLLLPPPREDGEPRRLLVPFSGAGSEVIGALRAGWDEVVGVEAEAEHLEVARRRIEALVEASDESDALDEAASQGSLFAETA